METAGHKGNFKWIHDQRAAVLFFISLQTFVSFRKRNSVVGSLSSLISKQSNLQEGRWTHRLIDSWGLVGKWKAAGSHCASCVCRGDARGDLLRRVSAAEGHADFCTGQICCLSTVYLIIILIITSINKNLRLIKAALRLKSIHNMQSVSWLTDLLAVTRSF